MTNSTKKRVIAIISSAVIGASILTMTCIGAGAKTIINNDLYNHAISTGATPKSLSNDVKTDRIKCDTLEQAMEITGINIRLPKVNEYEIFAVKGKYIEVSYAIDEQHTITIRKSADDKEYTGVECDIIVPFETENEISAFGKWVNNYNGLNFRGYNGAYFTTEDGTYSITYNCLLQLMDLSQIIDDFANAG